MNVSEYLQMKKKTVKQSSYNNLHAKSENGID